MSARHIIAEALAERREQLTGDASFMDNDGARLVLKHLERQGFAVTVPADVFAELRAVEARVITAAEKRTADECIAAVRKVFGVTE